MKRDVSAFIKDIGLGNIITDYLLLIIIYQN